MTTPASSLATLAAARSYLSRGWSVVPACLPVLDGPGCHHHGPRCQHPGKTPLIKWAPFRDRLPTEVELTDWWQRWPDANVAALCGNISRLMVLDVDPRHGGTNTLEALLADGKKMPDCPLVLTGGGGTHFYLQAPGPLASIPDLFPGIELKAEGATIIAPPSLHASGRQYEWAVPPEDAETWATPPWLREAIDRHHQARAGGALPESIPAGERNETLFRLAAAIRAKGLSAEGIVAALREENARCNPPLSDDEVVQIARSAGRYEPKVRVHDTTNRGQTGTLINAPVPQEANVPDGWEVTESGIWRRTYNERTGNWDSLRVAWGPVFIKDRLQDIETTEERLVLTFLRDGAWRSVTDFRDILMDGRKVVATSRFGVPIISGTAGLFSRYLAEYEAANNGAISLAPITTSCGWKLLGGQHLFVLGQRVLGGSPVSADQHQPLSFLAESEGQLAGVRSLSESGTLAEWREAIAMVAPYEKVMFAIYAALVPPMMGLLGAPNFIVHYAGQTSRGKTATLEIAASVWGFPQRERGGLVQGWDTTKVHAERLAALFNHIPVFLDDSQTADRRTQGSILYMIANGVGRGRGSPKGLRATLAWETVCLSTGEHPLAGAIQEGGARVRVLDLWGGPFGNVPVGDLVRGVVHRVRSVYGTAGTTFINYLLANQERWPEWRQQYTATAHDLSARFPGNAANIADRVSQYLAAVEVAGVVASEALDLPGSPVPQVVSEVMAELVGMDEGADYAARSRAHTVSWAISNRHAFDGQQGTRELSGGLLGRWLQGEYIAIFPHRLQELLERGGFEYEAVLRSWRDRGWLKTTEGNLTGIVRVGDATPRLVVLKWEALDMQTDEDEPGSN